MKKFKLTKQIKNNIAKAVGIPVKLLFHKSTDKLLERVLNSAVITKNKK